jgi:hypothetical protein
VRGVNSVYEPAAIVDGVGGAIADVFLHDRGDTGREWPPAGSVAGGKADADAALLIEADLGVWLPDGKGAAGDTGLNPMLGAEDRVLAEEVSVIT